MKAVWKDGKSYEGETSLDVVRLMLASSPFTDGLADVMYMRAVAMRALLYRGARVRSKDAVEFLHDLELAGYVTVEP